jgi:serine/threonine protein kinase
MDYYPLGNLSDADIDEGGKVTGLGQMLNAVEHLHKNEIVHRDIKPENILIMPQPLKFVLTDFELAKVIANAEYLKTFCGTYKYLAPEILPGESDVYGKGVDIWSLGVVVYELIYGIPELSEARIIRIGHGRSQQRRLQSWIDDWSQHIFNASRDKDNEEVIWILQRMIEIDPEKRWTAKQCLDKGFESSLFVWGSDDLIYKSDKTGSPKTEECDGTTSQERSRASYSPGRPTTPVYRVSSDDEGEMPLPQLVDGASGGWEYRRTGSQRCRKAPAQTQDVDDSDTDETATQAQSVAGNEEDEESAFLRDDAFNSVASEDEAGGHNDETTENVHSNWSNASTLCPSQSSTFTYPTDSDEMPFPRTLDTNGDGDTDDRADGSDSTSLSSGSSDEDEYTQRQLENIETNSLDEEEDSGSQLRIDLLHPWNVGSSFGIDPSESTSCIESFSTQSDIDSNEL